MKKIVVLLVVLLAASVSSAHQIYLESDLEYEPITNIGNAKSVLGYLEEGEVDIYNLLVTPADMGPPYYAAMAAVSVLPPACVQYKNFYPSVALIGPGLPPAPAGLPFAVPPGMGAVVVLGSDHVVKKDERPIYTTTDVEMNAWVDKNKARCAAEGIDLPYVTGNNSSYLPKGVSQFCLHCQYLPWLDPADKAACAAEDKSGSIFAPLFIPAMYQIAVFNESERPGDYSISVGIGEKDDTCQALERTLQRYQQIVDGDLLQMDDCVPAGESGFEGCPLPPFPPR